MSYISRLVRGIQSTIATAKKQENPLNTAQKIASESSTKQDEEATTEEVPGSIAIYTEKEINTVNRDVTLSVLSLGHFISFSFATKEVKGATYFLSRARGRALRMKTNNIITVFSYFYSIMRFKENPFPDS